MSTTPILQASKSDWIRTGVITAVCAIAIGGTFFTANIREAELVPASEAMPDGVEVLAKAPEKLNEVFTLSNPLLPGQHRALSAKGLLITHTGETITASDTHGEEKWR